MCNVPTLLTKWSYLQLKNLELVFDQVSYLKSNQNFDQIYVVGRFLFFVFDSFVYVFKRDHRLHCENSIEISLRNWKENQFLQCKHIYFLLISHFYIGILASKKLKFKYSVYLLKSIPSENSRADFGKLESSNNQLSLL